MHKTGIFRAVIFTVMLLFLIAPLHASAAGATQAYVNNVLLNAATPYWQNGSASASGWLPEDAWNAYFDATTATLTLKDAVINTIYNAGFGVTALVYAAEDLKVIIAGDSRLQYTGVGTDNVYGIYAAGNLTVTGNGSIDIRLQNLSGGSNFMYAVSGYSDLLIQSGTIHINMEGSGYVYGFHSYSDMTFTGGTATVISKGSDARIAYIGGGDFRMTGGSLNGTAESTETSARGIYASAAYLEGGTGVFISTGLNKTRGMLLDDGPLYVTGGLFRFIGDWEAMCIDKQPYVIEVAPTIPVYVSEYASGAGMRRWMSSADGKLAGDIYLGKTSPFLFVQFGEWPEAPQTGDGTRPWLWAGIMLCALMLSAGLAGRMRRRHL